MKKFQKKFSEKTLVDVFSGIWRNLIMDILKNFIAGKSIISYDSYGNIRRRGKGQRKCG